MNFSLPTLGTRHQADILKRAAAGHRVEVVRAESNRRIRWIIDSKVELKVVDDGRLRCKIGPWKTGVTDPMGLATTLVQPLTKCLSSALILWGPGRICSNPGNPNGGKDSFLTPEHVENEVTNVEVGNPRD